LRSTRDPNPVRRFEVLGADPDGVVFDEFRDIELDLAVLRQDLVYQLPHRNSAD